MTIRTAATAALTLTTALVLAGCVAGPGSYTMPGMDHGTSSEASVDANMADLMFTQMMIPHHQQAIEMSDMILAKDDIEADVRTLAEDIKAAQQPEIDQMEAWLDEWGADMPGSMDGMDHGDGMMTEADMDALDAATGAEASRLFLEQMIEHHEGAIDMAEEVIEDGQNEDVIALAQTIIEAQTAEIALMQDLLAQL